MLQQGMTIMQRQGPFLARACLGARLRAPPQCFSSRDRFESTAVLAHAPDETHGRVLRSSGHATDQFISGRAALEAEPGAFQKLPMVAPAQETMRMAFRKASRSGHNPKLKGEAARARNRGSRAMDTLMKQVCEPIGKYLAGFPKSGRLHPFDYALMDLTVGADRYTRALDRVESFRKQTVQARGLIQEVHSLTKAHAARISGAPTKAEATEAHERAMADAEATLGPPSAALDELKDVAKDLRRLPVVDLSGCTVALVGAPNVGKSSLVRRLSTGEPEICDYPFTTRTIKVGHFFVDGVRHQLTDTPGLLPRPEDRRNAMERLTLSTLLCLPTCVMFVADLTAECGMAVSDQWSIRRELRARFPDKLWIDVLSKADMLSARGFGSQQPERCAPTERADGEGSEEGPAEAAVVRTGEDWMAAVPRALLVSSTTGTGLVDLQAALESTVRRWTAARDAEGAGPGDGAVVIEPGLGA